MHRFVLALEPAGGATLQKRLLALFVAVAAASAGTEGGAVMPLDLVGVPVRLVSTIGITVAADSSGRQERIFCSFHNGRPPMFIAEIDPETGKVWKHYSPADSEQGAWAITTGPDGNVYVGTYYRGHLLRFDAKRRVFEDLGRPGGEQYFWTFSVAPDGRICGGGCQRGELVACDSGADRIEAFWSLVPNRRVLALPVDLLGTAG